MQREIIKGIAKAIQNEFGNAYTVYSEKVRQGVRKPCFFINGERFGEIPYIMGRYMKENAFLVSFYPQDFGDDGEKDQCGKAAERLFKCLEYIIVDGNLTRGSKMSGEIRDGVLKFSVNYDMFVVKPKEEIPAMENLDFRTGNKTGLQRKEKKKS